MSNYGLIIYNANGEVALDGGDMLTRLIYSFTAPYNTSGAHTLPFTPDWSKCGLVAISTGDSATHACYPDQNKVEYRVSNGVTGPSLVKIFQYR